MKINISGLSEGAHRYDLNVSAGDIGLESNFIGEVVAHITLEKSIHQLLALVNASVKGVFVCDRCAEEFTETVTTDFRYVFSWEQTDEPETEESEDFQILRKEENSIDLSEQIREYLLISVPVKLLCKNNCEIPLRGYLAEETMDPRWEALKKLQQSEKN